MIATHITQLIGNTPLFLIPAAVHGLSNVNLYAKLEYMNPFGSVKDRIGWGLIESEIPTIIAKNQTLIESSSGNTAKAMQGIGSTYGINLKTVTNRIKIPEQKMILQLMGAQIEELPGKSQCPDPSDPNDPHKMIDNYLSQQPSTYFHTSQYTNPLNPSTHYDHTGKEILEDLSSVDFFFGGLGTTGSTGGTGKRLKENNQYLKMIGIVSKMDDVIPGIRSETEMNEVDLYDPSQYASLMTVDSLQAIDRMVELIRKCGLCVGPTTGAAYEGVIKYFSTHPVISQTNVLFIACDRFEPYLSYIRERRPQLFNEQPKTGSIKQLTKAQQDAAAEINVRDVQSWIDSSRPLVVDIRSNISFQAAHIPGSINIPEDTFIQTIDNTKAFCKGSKLLIVCPTGERSKKFSAYLNLHGYPTYSLTGGLLSWKQAGKTLESLFN